MFELLEQRVYRPQWLTFLLGFLPGSLLTAGAFAWLGPAWLPAAQPSGVTLAGSPRQSKLKTEDYCRDFCSAQFSFGVGFCQGLGDASCIDKLATSAYQKCYKKCVAYVSARALAPATKKGQK